MQDFYASLFVVVVVVEEEKYEQNEQGTSRACLE